MTQIPIKEQSNNQLNYYRELSYSQKGKLVEQIGNEFLQYYAFETVEIKTKALQKTEGDTVVNIVILRLPKKQVTADYKAGGSSKGYNDLCVDRAYFTKEGEPKVKDYLNFLKSGGSNDPIELLKGAGVDLSTTAPIIAAVDDFRETLAELKKVMKDIH